MRVVIQRVSQAQVTIGQDKVASILHGFVILLGIEIADTQDDIEWLCNKVIGLRVFADENGKMNLSINEVNGQLLVVSQFTLYASTKKGNRPSFLKSAPPQISEPLYELFCKRLGELSETKIEKGIFGADMQVGLINEGPVTIIIDSKNRE